jgi:hypothetical protein
VKLVLSFFFGTSSYFPASVLSHLLSISSFNFLPGLELQQFFKIVSKSGILVVNFMCQLDWALGYTDI